MVLTLHRIYIYIYLFRICNRLVEVMKSGHAGIFALYYSLRLFLMLSKNAVEKYPFSI